ncbi:MAG: histidine kinase, partial [Mesorhizobium sp.]
MRSKASEKDYTQERSDEVIAMHPAESGMQVGRALLHALHN